MYFLLISILGLYVGVNTADPCLEFKTCGKCIGNSLNCVWCPDKDHTGPRCAENSTLKINSAKKWCSSIVDPQTEKPKTKKNDRFRPNSKKQSAVQVKPQIISIKARPGDKVPFELQYKPAQDYPIDIYYLFDNSYTMSKHKDRLVVQARSIHDELEKLSNNVRFGAGSFIEKLAFPFANPEPAKHKLNTFNNHISLTDDISKFVDVVKAVEHSGNYDDPECGLDALMQVMVCDEINWRKEARRMIILSTDATYHSAGDGKFVGAFKHNDMKCHLVKYEGKDNYTSHTYDKTASLTYDYPSVSQINKIASENDFSIYFTALKNVEKIYQALAQRIQGAKYVELSTDPDAIGSMSLVELLKTEYLKLVHNVEIDIGEVPSHINLSLEPRCIKDSHDRLCEIAHASVLKINGTIEIKNCPSNGNVKDKIIIKPVGLRESLVIEVEAICECDCEKDNNGEKNSKVCNSIGTYQCGICKCNKNWYGSYCQCPGDSTEERDIQQCKAKTEDTKAKVCSGRGECKCGKCECWEGYEGDYCEYRTNDCPAFENKVCNNKGKCKKSQCECWPGWKGIDCTCSTDTNICVGANSKVCSGNGDCICGLCECTRHDTQNYLYKGKYCDLCDTCAEQRCKDLGDYVLCNYEGDQKQCDQKHNIKTVHMVSVKNQTEINSWLEGTRCTKVLDDQSSIVFKYLDGNNSTLILIQKEKELPPEIPVGLAIGSTLGGILLIGLVTLIVWKILVDIHDRREYKKFAEESKAAGFDVSTNPLYAPPAININNPAYCKDG